MTTIAFGGGPTLQQRRGFTSLRDGTHVPGYRGYCPQIKYRVGKTYGTDTHELAQTRIHVHPTQTVTRGEDEPLVQLRNTLPKPTGDNKYTESMVPGYTGYIPRMTFRFGGTYKTDCDLSIDEHMTNRTTHDLRQGDLRRSVTMVPRLTATSHDPHVRDQLDLYRDTHPTRPMLMEDRRPLTEPPLPGYNGYIPRVKPTELGLGHRYHVACDKGFNAFVQETARHSMNTTGVLPRALEGLPREQLQSARQHLTDASTRKMEWCQNTQDTSLTAGLFLATHTVTRLEASQFVPITHHPTQITLLNSRQLTRSSVCIYRTLR